MTIAEMIYQKVQMMPNHLAQEILDFTEYLQIKWEAQSSIQTQSTNLSKIAKAKEIAPINLLKLLEQCPVGSQTSEDIDKQLQALRDEWPDHHAIS